MIDQTALKEVVFYTRKEALEKGYEVAFSVAGRSMLPILQRNDKILVAKCGIKDLKIGDMILHNLNKFGNNICVAHRLVKIKHQNSKATLVTKGDSRFNYDRPVGENAFIGKVIRITKRNLTFKIDRYFWTLINLSILFLSMSMVIPLSVYVIRKTRHLVYKNGPHNKSKFRL